eukprot:m.112376 g.112376  ORF g.112376 m.112376 type:complete len:436 (-) comp12784_c0_seq1:2097-3404(-)
MVYRCSLRACGKEIKGDSFRVEIAGNVKRMKSELKSKSTVVDWKVGKDGVCGDAVFHEKCYTKLENWLNGQFMDEDEDEVKKEEEKGDDKGQINTSSSSHKMTTRSKRPKRMGDEKRKKKKIVYFSDRERDALEMAIETAEFIDGDSGIENAGKKVAEFLKKAKHACIFSGAGLSTSAGIGDYRGKKGKWTEEDTGVTQEEEGVPYEKLRPTYSHEAISKLVEMGLIKYVISQNCDGLHVLSGIPLDKISELHGNIYLERCVKCGKTYTRNFYTLDDASEAIVESGKIPKGSHIEVCSTCGINHFTGRRCDDKKCKGKLKDTIINFGDLLGEDILGKAETNSKLCDLMISVGSTMTVTPASTLVTPRTKSGKLVVVNRQRTEFDDRSRRTGVRVFGNIDPFFRAVMKHTLSKPDLKEWEKEIEKKRKWYDTQRRD